MAKAPDGTEMSPTIDAIIDAERKHIIDWATSMMQFVMQDRQDQVDLLYYCWDPLVIFSIAHRSQQETDKLLLATGEEMQIGSLLAEKVGITISAYTIMVSEFLPKLRKVQFDETEWRHAMGLMAFYRRLDEGPIRWAFESIKADMEKYWKKRRSRDSVHLAEMLFDIKRHVERIACRCTSSLHLLFPDNQQLRTFLLKKFPSPKDDCSGRK